MDNVDVNLVEMLEFLITTGVTHRNFVNENRHFTFLINNDKTSPGKTFYSLQCHVSFLRVTLRITIRVTIRFTLR